MPWELEEIQREWLRGATIDVKTEALVDGFNRADAALGREWVESRRIGPGGLASFGAVPTLVVMRIGEMLATLDGVPGSEKLIEKIRSGDRAAHAELMGVYLLRRGRPQIAVEMYPRVTVGTREREPDFRVRKAHDPWTYVEVANPDTADAQRNANAVLQRLSQVVSSVKKSFALEVFLFREPGDDQIEELAAALPAFCSDDGVSRVHVKDFAILVRNHTSPGQIVPYQHPEDDGRPRLAMARSIVGGSEPPRHVAVRIPYADKRAEAFLTTEARQLPTDAPGLIMINMRNAPGGIKTWASLLRRRLQPKMHTRVGGVCLFFEAVLPTERGIALSMETGFLRNLHARLPLPAWIESAIEEAGAEFRGLVQTPRRT